MCRKGHDVETTTKRATTRLGQTDLEITRVSFGAWAIGRCGGGGFDHSWGPQDDTESIAAIRLERLDSRDYSDPLQLSDGEVRYADVAYESLILPIEHCRPGFLHVFVGDRAVSGGGRLNQPRVAREPITAT